MDADGNDDDAVASFAIARQNAALRLRAAALKEADPSYGDSDAEEPPAPSYPPITVTDADGDDAAAVASFAIARQNAALHLRAALKEADPSYGDSDAAEPPADVSVPVSVSYTHLTLPTTSRV